MQSLASQFYAFLVTVSIGGIVGILYDIYKVLLSIVRPKKVVNNLGDLLFWIIVTIIGFCMLIIGNWGEIRLYVFVGIFLGVAIYFKLLSRSFIFLFRNLIILLGKVFDLLVRMFIFLWTAITYPFILIRNIIVIPIGFMGKTLTGLSRSLTTTVNSVATRMKSKRLFRIKNRINSFFKKKS